MQLLKIFTAATIVLSAVCCKKDVLEQTPKTNISDADFWKSTNDLKLYCNNFYNNYLPYYGGYGTIGIFGSDADQGSDNMITMTYNKALNGERTLPASASAAGWSWDALRNINHFFDNYKKVNASAENVNPYVGEALFFRANYYYGMLRTFGDLPWISRELNPASSDLYNERLPRNVIVDSILLDLDNALAYLPSKAKQEASRINKEVAMLLQARIALYEGTWEKYHAGTDFGVRGSDGNKYLNKAAAVSEALIALNIYSLDNMATGQANGYWQLFNQTDYSGSSEVMFWRKYDKSLGITHNWHRYTISGAGRGLTKNLVDAYLCTDGKPISVSPLYKGDDSLRSVVLNRDPRLVQTIYVNDDKHTVTSNQPGGADNKIFTVPSFDQANETKPATGYQCYKGHNPDYYQQYAGDQGTTGCIIFRYAEALLIFAEAKAELGTLTQADVDKSINLLRTRVGMPALNISSIVPDPKWEFPELTGIVNEVRRERRIELACEGYRHDDIFRWAAAGKLIKGWQPQGAKKAQWINTVPESQLTSYPVDANGYIVLYSNLSPMANGYQFNVNRDYLSPMPTNEIQLNPTLKQNPGW